MKKIISIILVSIILLPNICFSRNEIDKTNTKPIFTNLLENEGIDTYRIPTFLVKYILSFDKEAQEVKPLFNGSRFINFAICERSKKNYNGIFSRICDNLEVSSYKNLVEITDKESKITIKALIDNEKIREIVMLIVDDDSFIALSMTGKIDSREFVESLSIISKANSKYH
ncbi:MAG: DUF4252 domain-containing protein [Tenuifilaceae bacterium]